jgi:hypothetical protein
MDIQILKERIIKYSKKIGVRIKLLVSGSM